MKVRTLIALITAIALICSGTVATIHQPATGTAVASTSSTVQPSDSYVLEQGGECRRIEPLQSGESIEEFYDYRNHETHPEDVERRYSSHGTTHLQEDDTSILFLHEGTNGTSLVMVHDRLGGETSGGVVTFDIVGLPSDAEWVVQDDLYDGETNMVEWYRGERYAGASWIWSESRTDGGAIRGGLDDDFAVTIHPAFNEDAEHYDNDDLHDPDYFEDGELTEWEALSGSAEDPDRTTLSMDEPVTIRTGTCDDPSVSYERTDDGISATVTGAEPDDRVAVTPTTGSNDAIEFEEVELRDVESDGSISFVNGQTDVPKTSPNGVESFTDLTITTDGGISDAAATVSFTVNGSYLEDREIEPERVALYVQDGETWTESPTTLRDESGDSYRFTANVTSLSTVTVAPAQENEGAAPSSLYGIGLGLTVGTLLCIGLLITAKRRRG
ncbi:PGF-pre-PGF domain-containing protein [Halosolutus halophilus]|uniref:PGF-pre-PGF domain-containing protein n=1 Tax=Halosolutus halophilus TaxID=1552990 RepID=UPI0022352381|nr:PGF-pre-PGF domain-containing protein [Halosolutus halophilus]